MWQRLPLPKGVDSVNVPRFKVGTQSGAMSDGASVPSRDFTDTLVTADLITIAGQDEHGAEVQYELEEPYSRVAQHEFDHLDGVLILDRTTPEAQREALASLRPRIVIG